MNATAYAVRQVAEEITRATARQWLEIECSVMLSPSVIYISNPGTHAISFSASLTGTCLLSRVFSL
ncbi:MAG: hypothetical protein RQ842_06665 [Vulcanisaeta sp.]|nr:hypothetical protein [Vulcanisaeta sp.]